MTTTSSWPNLSNSPLVEGLIDIRIERSRNVTFEELKAACDELATEFSSRQERRMVVTELNFTSETGPTSQTKDNGPDAMILQSVDQKWVVQFRLDGFTVSRLQPYGTWDELKGKARVLWDKYSEVAKPSKVVRVACRFINCVPLPMGDSFEKVFQTNFVIGPTLPQAVSGYLLRFVIPFEEQNALAIVTQSLDGNSPDCIFDIDVFSQNQQGFDESQLWAKIENLRDVKNRLFFGSLTELALERFK